MTRVWIVAALSVLLIAGCNSNGSSSSSKDSLYRQIFAPAPAPAPASENQEPNMINSKEFPGEYLKNTKSPDFFEYYHPSNDQVFEALAVLVESTPTVNKYVYILETIDTTDKGLGGVEGLPMGPLSYTGKIEYFDPEKDPDLETVNKNGVFKLTRTFKPISGNSVNSIELDWNGDGSDLVQTGITVTDDHDFSFTHDIPNSEKKLIGQGTFYQNWRKVYGLFKSPNHAGGFKGDCQDCDPGQT